MELSVLEQNCNYVFKDKELLKKALTLSSYDGGENNEALECLGDAILSFLVAEKYYQEGASESVITQMKQRFLSDEALAPVSERLGLADALIAGKGDTHNKKAVPSVYEAFVAAVYLDGGMDKARAFALSTLTPLPQPINYIAEVQEILQAEGKLPPTYNKSVGGTKQKPWLTVTVQLDGRTFKGEGENFQRAKKAAAKSVYEYLKSL